MPQPHTSGWQENFKAWNDALRAKDFNRATALYSSSDLTFLPTVSSDFIRDVPSTRRYFMAFVERLPVGEIVADNVQCLGPDAYLHTGLYTFMTGPEEGRVPVDARFSYMWRKTNGDWRITHHHSSVVPGGKRAVDMSAIAQASILGIGCIEYA